ncbi:hypothetical protein ACNFJ7_06955 [Sphingomonas sp. HT-1]|jgi:hypothetical protein|uniref:hypothetical protein n=1 Tax=unclassified Sphingomonas TaxID=196159 RepID=UPI000366E65A|nr:MULTISPECIES: hypothetical protein [unclassified Sphingomonas]KTF70163.1 hypothetical protein ATB93_06075 [Sphingomonas sp. WG]
MMYSSLADVVQQSAVATMALPRDTLPSLAPAFRETREIARRLLEEAGQEAGSAALLREAAHELLKLDMLLGPVPESQLCADYVRTKLGLRHRGSALLLLELLARPGVPRRARDLAPLVCTKSVNTSSVKVFVHELRGVVARFGIEDAIGLKVREGYYLAEEAAPKIMALLH